MRIFNYIIELLISPFTVLIRLNINTINTKKVLKSILILVISIVFVSILILFAYRKFIFK